jgi:hypothetical protein
MISHDNLKVKRLETELMPFMDRGQSALSMEKNFNGTYTITNDGRYRISNIPAGAGFAEADW